MLSKARHDDFAHLIPSPSVSLLLVRARYIGGRRQGSRILIFPHDISFGADRRRHVKKYALDDCSQKFFVFRWLRFCFCFFVAFAFASQLILGKIVGSAR